MRICVHAWTAALFVTLCALCRPAHADGLQQFADLGDLHLQSGKVIENCRLGYRTYGKMRPDGSNVILFPTWFTGTTADMAEMFAPNQLIDPRRYCTITVDSLGDGVSSSPSNSEAQRDADFPAFTIQDMVNAEHAMLLETFHLKHIHAVMGISMGGMQTFQWMVSYPRFMDVAIPIVGSPKLASYDLLLWNTELRMIESSLSPLAHRNAAALRSLADITVLMLTTPRHHVTATPPGQATRVLDEEERRIAGKSVYDWASQLRAMIGQDIFRPFGESEAQAARAVKARVLVIVSESDHMVNPAPALEFARRIHARAITVRTDMGHVATGESDQFEDVFDRFLKR
jgi:homoserine O-acetyltransferase